MDEAKLKEWAQQRCVGTTLYWEYLVAHTRDLLAMQREEDAKVCEEYAAKGYSESRDADWTARYCASAIRKGKP